jgi:Flp pilus assembly protein TadG
MSVQRVERRSGVPARAVRAERGAVAVEFALIVPMLIMLLMGVTTTGLTYSDHLAISNGAREGSRFGAALDYSTGGSAWADAVQSRVVQVYANGSSTLSSSQVCVQLETSTGTVLAVPTAQGTDCGTTPTSPTSMTTGTCVVKVWVRKPASINLVIFSLPTFTISSKSVAYYGRAVSACPGS